MKRFKKLFIYFVWGILFICGCEEVFRRFIGGFAGSYPFAESWDIDARESDVIKAIKQINFEDSLKGNPKVKLSLISKRDTVYDWLSPEMVDYQKRKVKDTTLPLPKFDSHNSYPDYWLFIDFYYTGNGQVLHTWTRPEQDSTKTTIAFVSLTNRNSNDSRLINKDFGYFENKREIKKFETLIIDRVKQRIRK